MKNLQVITFCLSALLVGCGGDCLNPAICDESNDNQSSISSETSNTSSALYSISGIGDNVFSIPDNVTKINIKATYDKRSSNFIVDIGGDLIVNEIIGTNSDILTFEGTYLLKDGRTTEITNSSGVSWTFTEVR